MIDKVKHFFLANKYSKHLSFTLYYNYWVELWYRYW